MRITTSILALLICLCAVQAKSINDVTYKVYSMVFSGKYYNPGEQKTFFFSIPMTFDTMMKVDETTKSISLDFINAKNGKSNHKIVIEEGKKAEQSSYKTMINFTDNYTKVGLDLDFVKNTEFALTHIKEYQNKTFSSIQIKITQPGSKVNRSFYITFDFAKGVADESDISLFSKFVHSIETKPTLKQTFLELLEE